MNFLILGGSRNPELAEHRSYRGTYRRHPTYCDALPEHDEINQLFFWFIQEGGELGLVQDLRKARRFAHLWNARLMEPEHFEVIAVTDGGSPPVHGGTFLGFDLSEGYNNSLLVWGLRQFTGVTSLPNPIRDLSGLVTRHYAPQLNASGLFDTFEVATLCLKSVAALQELSPNLFEGGNLKGFHPVGLHMISDD